MNLLDGRVVVVSGVGPGLGRQLALKAVAAGAAVALGARTSATLEEVAGEVRDAGGRVVTVPCDITRDADCAALVSTALEAFGRVDGLVNNAFALGSMNEPLEDADLDAWREVFDVNVFGSLRMTRAALPALKEAGGAVVFVSSQIVRRPFPGRAAYAGSKAALMTAAQVLAREVGKDGVRVNSVVPGRMWGPPLQGHLDRLATASGRGPEAHYRDIVEQMSLGRIPTDAECADVALFLLSDLAAALTGQAIDANGGETFH